MYRLMYLSPLQKIIYSFLKSDYLDENNFKKFEDENKSLIEKLLIARFALVYPKFDKDFDYYFFDPSEDDGFERSRNRLKELNEEKVINTILFDQLYKFSLEMKTVNYNLKEYSPFFGLVRVFFLSKGYSLLSNHIAAIRAIMRTINDEMANCRDNRADACRIRDNLCNLLSISEKTNAVARLLWMEMNDSKKPEKAKFADELLKLNEAFDNASRNLDIISRKYDFDYQYEITYKIEVEYFKIYNVVFYNFKYTSDEIQPSASSLDETRSYALAFIKFSSDMLSASWARAHLIANYSANTKIFADIHFENIRKDINSEYLFYIDNMCRFLKFFVRMPKGRNFFKCNALFKEFYLDYALKINDTEKANILIKLNGDNVDIDTLFIVRKYQPQKYKDIVDKFSEEYKKQLVETLKSNESIYELYGKDFCDELYKLCI